MKTILILVKPPTTTQCDRDYAEISDFTTGEDLIQLGGGIGDYVFDTSNQYSLIGSLQQQTVRFDCKG